jgi:hypothetical protein
MNKILDPTRSPFLGPTFQSSVSVLVVAVADLSALENMAQQQLARSDSCFGELSQSQTDTPLSPLPELPAVLLRTT